MKRGAFTKIIILLVIVGIVCCALWLSLGQLIRAKEIRNVLLISIDTCRADFLSCYDFPLKTTPNIDALATEGMLFEQAISPMPITLPGHCSMLTGTIPPYHGVLDNGLFALAEENVTLAEMLKEHGFATGAFISSYILDSVFGLKQGFDVYNDKFENSRNTMGVLERQGDETTELALQWIEKHKEERQFLFVHLYDPHFSYDAPEPYGSRFKSSDFITQMPDKILAEKFASYAGEIAFADYCIGKIISRLKELKLYDSTLICITSDHGEMLGQHGEFTHGYFIYQGNVRVPLVFKVPGMKKSLRVKSCVGLVDIVPTICSALGIEIEHRIHGQDLLAYNDGEPYPEKYVFCQSLEPTKYNANPLLGVVNNRYKYIDTTRPELYDLPYDLFEIDNLVKNQPNRARQMQDRLQQIIQDAATGKETNGSVGVDAEILEKLESLGYVGSPVDETFIVDPAKEDPKDLIGFHARFMEVGFFVQQKKLETAAEICQQLLSELPSFYLSHFVLGKISILQDDHAGAIPYLQRAIELKPDHANSHIGLGKAYKALGQLDKAIDHYHKVLEVTPDTEQVHYFLVLCFFEQGRFNEADRHIRQSLFGNSEFSDAIVRLADKLIKLGQIKLAHDYYAEGLRFKPDWINILNSLAWIQAASDIKNVRNPLGAVDLAQKACELDEYQTSEYLDTLAVAYAASGAFEKAVSTAEKAVELAESDDKKDLAKRIQNRIELYKARQVFLDPALSQENAHAEPGDDWITRDYPG